MKKALIILCIILLLAGAVYAGSMKWAVGLTGGGNALDGITSPAAGDTAMVFTSLTSTTDATFSLYYAVTGTTDESSPDRILPNTNANGVTWWRVGRMSGLLSAPTGTGFMVIYTSGTVSLVSANTATSALLGVDASGTIGLYNSLILSTGAITGTSLFSAQTCSSPPQFVTGITSTGYLTCATP